MKHDITATFDTNVAPFDELLWICDLVGGIDTKITATTYRELSESSFMHNFLENDETITYNEKSHGTYYAVGVLAELAMIGETSEAHGIPISDDTKLRLFVNILAVLSNGSVNFPCDSSKLTDGNLHHLRDANIFFTHSRNHRDYFVTDDKAFLEAEKKAVLENLAKTKIVKRAEFEFLVVTGRIFD